jgi:hypothetical protein
MGRRKPKQRQKAAGTIPGGVQQGEAPPSDRLRPWLLGAVVALFVARPLFPSETPAETGDGLPVVMLWIGVAVVWMLGAIGRRRFPIRFGWTDAAVVGLVAWHALAAVLATCWGSPRPALNMLWEWVGLGFGFLLARQFIATRREARAVVVVMVGLAVALAGYGLYQYQYEMPHSRALYEANPDEALRQAGLNYPKGSPQRLAFEKRLESKEPLATFALANSLAGFLAPWLVVAAAIAVVGGTSRRWVGLACCGLPMAIGLLLTKSRSGYVAVLAGLLMLGVWWLTSGAQREGRSWSRSRTLVLAVAIVLVLAGGVVAAAVAVGGLDVQVVSEASKSLGYRLQYWESSAAIIADHPVFGCGPGNFQQTYTRYKLPQASEEVADPHNFILEIWATAGTPAFVLLLVVLGTFARTIWRHRKDPGEDEPADPAQEGQSADGSIHVLAGAVCGFLLSIPLGLISAAPPGMAPVVLGLPLAAAVVTVLYGWIAHGRLPPVVPGIGVAVLLINLLAAGGIGFSGVAGSLWLLLALGLNVAEDGAAGQDAATLPWGAAAAGLVLTLVLAIACHSTAYGPVLQSQTAMGQAERDPAHAERLLLSAAELDPLASKPWEQLVVEVFGQWQKATNPDDRVFSRFEQCAQAAAELAPNSAAAWKLIGDCYLAAGHRLQEVSEAKNRKRDHQKAIHAYRKAEQAYRHAVALYPASAPNRARLAEVFLALQDQTGFRHQAEVALRLDEATPHADKKLDDELRKQLSREISGP